MKTILGFLICGVSFAQTQNLWEELRSGNTAKVKESIEKGADVKTKDAAGNTPLMHAAVYSTRETLELFLSRGADVNAANNAGHTALMRAMPDLEKIRLLVESGANVNAANVEGRTPLMFAAGIRGADAIVRYLLEKGAKIDTVDKTGSDAVMVAAGAGSAKNLKILLDAGAKAATQLNLAGGPMPPPGALPPVMEQVIKRGVEAGTGATGLMGAAAADCDECVRMLLQKGAVATAKTKSGNTSLHLAAYEGNPVTVRLLLDAGAQANVADDRGFTPLMMAVNSRSKNPEVVRLLIKAGADPKAKDTEGRTAADWARIGAQRDIVRLIPGATLPPRQVPVSGTLKNPKEAVQKSLAMLESVAPTFFPKSGCISCHNVSIPMVALHVASRTGFNVKANVNQQMVKHSSALLTPFRENLLSAYCSVPGMSTTSTYALISMHQENYKGDLLTDSVARCLIAAQDADGHWPLGDRRPPLSSDGIPAAALSARTIQLYAPPSMTKAAEASIAKAKSYLMSTKAWTGDDHAFKLIGLSWLAAAQNDIDMAAAALLKQQRVGGGWAQTPDMQPDAYATGLALSAISMASPALVKSAAYKRGTDYLLRTQKADGSWHVRTRAFGFQPYFESGFPHGHDQWISMAATAWASIALMPVAETPKTTAP
ncbi:MAG: ankyrin repeat domain-containing protein [Candidatus Solibacter usitatus]|nr:ankyrin repeat domain-containing protein [Candidatus Solibacter usitatus]